MLSKERERDWCRAAKSYNCVTSVQINWRKFKDNKLELCLRGELSTIHTLERMRRQGGGEEAEDTIHISN